jgi:hypothetical protein
MVRPWLSVLEDPESEQADRPAAPRPAAETVPRNPRREREEVDEASNAEVTARAEADMAHLPENFR